jgi:hypothetical protein
MQEFSGLGVAESAPLQLWCDGVATRRAAISLASAPPFLDDHRQRITPQLS